MGHGTTQAEGEHTLRFGHIIIPVDFVLKNEKFQLKISSFGILPVIILNSIFSTVLFLKCLFSVACFALQNSHV